MSFLPVYADMGPKPSVHIDVECDEDVYHRGISYVFGGVYNLIKVMIMHIDEKKIEVIKNI